MKKITINLFIVASIVACSNPEQQTNNETDTLVVVTKAAAMNSGIPRITQTVLIGEPPNKVSFSINKPQLVSIRTTQLTKYPYSIRDVYNAKIDTTGILSNNLIITPTDSVFGFKIFQNFQIRPAVLAYTDYDQNLDSTTTQYINMTNEQIVAEINLNATK